MDLPQYIIYCSLRCVSQLAELQLDCESLLFAQFRSTLQFRENVLSEAMQSESRHTVLSFSDSFYKAFA